MRDWGWAMCPPLSFPNLKGTGQGQVVAFGLFSGYGRYMTICAEVGCYQKTARDSKLCFYHQKAKRGLFHRENKNRRSSKPLKG